ncbi:hypothetical protein ACEUA8_10205, partial [Aeromonas veronii]
MSLKPHGRDSFITLNATPDFTIAQQITWPPDVIAHKNSNKKTGTVAGLFSIVQLLGHVCQPHLESPQLRLVMQPEAQQQHDYSQQAEIRRLKAELRRV